MISKTKKVIIDKVGVSGNRNITLWCPLINTQWDGTACSVGRGRGLWEAVPRLA
jgi:hypothetical protein